jgi:hypothetical protein
MVRQALGVTGQEDAMSLSGFLPAASRRVVVMGGVAALVSMVSGSALRAQATAPQAPAAQAAAPPDPLKFDTATPRVVFMSLTADGEQAFEAALIKAKDVLSKPAATPEQKQQAAHWKVLKAKPEADGSFTLFMLLDAVVPNVSYNPFAILYASGLPADQLKTDVQPLMDRVNAGSGTPAAAMKGFKPFEVSTLVDMAGSGGGGD